MDCAFWLSDPAEITFTVNNRNHEKAILSSTFHESRTATRREYGSGLVDSKTSLQAFLIWLIDLPHTTSRVVWLRGPCYLAVETEDVTSWRGLIYLKPSHHLNTFRFVTNPHNSSDLVSQAVFGTWFSRLLSERLLVPNHICINIPSILCARCYVRLDKRTR